MKAKPILLSVFVVVTFVLYSLQQRHEGSGSAIAPSTIKTPAAGQPAASNSGNTGSQTSSAASSGSYKDGTYTGDVADAFYGNIQVQAVVSGGKLTAINVLQYPNEQDNSIRINSQALPWLKQEAVQAQSANIDMITGATDTSNAFIESLGSALQKAQIG